MTDIDHRQQRGRLSKFGLIAVLMMGSTSNSLPQPFFLTQPHRCLRIPSIHALSLMEREVIMRGGDAVIHALRAPETLQAFATRHERLGVEVADGYARATGKVGVAMTGTGPGRHSDRRRPDNLGRPRGG